MTEKTKRVLSTALKFIIAGILLWLVFGSGKIDFSKMSSLFSLSLGLPLVAIVLLNLVFAVLRWGVILKSQGLSSKFKDIFKLTLIGSFFNYAIPGGVGGDLVKGFYFVRENAQARLKSAVTIIIDRLIGLFSMAFLGLAALLLYPSLIATRWEIKFILLALSGIILCFCLLWTFIFSRRLYDSKINQFFLQKIQRVPKLFSLYEALCHYRFQKQIFFKAILLSFAAQALSVLGFILIGFYFDYDTHLLHYFFAVPVGYIITAIPISPAGIGLGQAAFYFLFNVVSGNTSDLGAIAISMIQVVTFILSLPGALFYISYSKKMKQN